jgi:hypothetical protein
MSASDPKLLDWTMRVLGSIDEMLRAEHTMWTDVAAGRVTVTRERAQPLLRQCEQARLAIAQHLEAGRQLQVLLAPVPRERMQ